MNNLDSQSNLAGIQVEHQEMLKYITEHSDAIDISVIRNFLQKLSELGAIVSSPADRGNLRSLIRYWSTFVNDKTGEYPSIQLQPFVTTKDSVNTEAPPFKPSSATIYFSKKSAKADFLEFIQLKILKPRK